MADVSRLRDLVTLTHVLPHCRFGTKGDLPARLYSNILREGGCCTFTNLYTLSQAGTSSTSTDQKHYRFWPSRAVLSTTACSWFVGIKCLSRHGTASRLCSDTEHQTPNAILPAGPVDILVFERRLSILPLSYTRGEEKGSARAVSVTSYSIRHKEGDDNIPYQGRKLES